MAEQTSSNRSALNDSGHSRTVRNALRVTYGTPLFLVQHAWRQRYIDRFDSGTVSKLSESMPPEEPLTVGSSVQLRSDGCGPIVMRTFDVRIDQPVLSPAELMQEFRKRSNSFVPRHIAGFYAGDDDLDSMEVGGEFVVELPGPWNGPVRIDSRDESSVVMITVSGHMEAGHIRFAVIDADDGGYSFQIRSWARAGDELFEHLHLVVGIAHEAQTAMWVHTCDRAVSVSGGRRGSSISVRTEELAGSDQEC